MSEALAFSLENVSKYFGRKPAVDDLSFSVPEGSLYGFIGPNGSGKTTSLRLILRILQPDKGTVTVLGERGHDSAIDQLGYLPEERGLYRKMKVGAQLRYFGQLKGMSARAATEAAHAWLERLQLADCWGKHTEALSKGMAQKVQFIAAVQHRPRLLVLDEPFSGLDPVNLELFLEVIRDLRKNGTTVILSTHDMGIAERLCDAVLMIHRGCKVLDGPLAAIRQKHGQDVIRVELDGGWDALQAMSIPSLELVLVEGDRLAVRTPIPPEELARLVANRGNLRHFECVQPSLHEIFIRIAGPEAEESATHSAAEAIGV